MTAYELGRDIGRSLGHIDFSVSERNMIALAIMPYSVFAEYVPDGNREYEKGEVVRIDRDKYLLQGFGKIDPSNPPRIEGDTCMPPLCKLFRDAGRYDWVREEFCLKGWERHYDDGDPGRTGWYRVIAETADSSTPPPSLPLVWEKIVE